MTMTDHIARAQAGLGGSPLSKDQKKRVVLAALAAWKHLSSPGFADQPAGIPPAMLLSEREAFDLWRQDEQARTTGKLHLTTSASRMFPALMAHFARLAGDDKGFAYWSARVIGDPHRCVLAKLRHEMAAAQDVIARPVEYIASIARCKFKTTEVDALSDRQIWVLIFDLRRAAQKRRARPATC
jgi:hypothetical protein